ncbi:3'(2'),5'-bisphosphate nucleotidase CysQ [Methylobacterium sp. J-076]|uniref:3'(2'),5'-bisphosphate nucleotidase CysQ family protein n=1 Tax=Methylobacterium sp. J-076 TaxID=2836655 RepID=UPI001FB9C105|nr:3'(2'),5'-bisphosphate nucleotidase CysQ [Methylobacterium sp. J-076]MCJ2014794.1 3'(2'),5'-bisphosphate nucleotidase CysQ [Methylobacterium sp. J-076]
MTDAATMTEAEAGRVAGTLAEIACAAGTVLRRWHGGDCPHVLKVDGSPSSTADIEAEALILEALAARFPGIPIVAEESGYDRGAGDLFFLVDPLDGTRDFLAGTPHYSVNIALVAQGRPIAAALAAPGHDRVWLSAAEAFEAPIRDGRPGPAHPVHSRRAPEAGLLALGSRRHGDLETAACLASLPVLEVRTSGSALKFGLLASGEADIYIRCGATMEWDTAAGDAILTAAGGCVVVPGGGPIRYGRVADGFRNGPFAALGDPALAADVTLIPGATCGMPRAAPAAR